MTAPDLTSVLLASSDPDRLRAWYVELLGTEPDVDGFLHFGSVAVLIDGRDDSPPVAQEPGRVILNYHVTDIAALRPAARRARRRVGVAGGIPRAGWRVVRHGAGPRRQLRPGHPADPRLLRPAPGPPVRIPGCPSALAGATGARPARLTRPACGRPRLGLTPSRRTRRVGWRRLAFATSSALVISHTSRRRRRERAVSIYTYAEPGLGRDWLVHSAGLASRRLGRVRGIASSAGRCRPR